MLSGDVTAMLIGIELIFVVLFNFFVVRRWVKFDKTLASWVRLFIHDFINCALVVFIVIAIIENTVFLKFVGAMDWRFTFVIIILAIFFRWFMSGLFRRPKDQGRTGDQNASHPAN